MQTVGQLKKCKEVWNVPHSEKKDVQMESERWEGVRAWKRMHLQPSADIFLLQTVFSVPWHNWPLFDYVSYLRGTVKTLSKSRIFPKSLEIASQPMMAFLNFLASWIGEHMLQVGWPGPETDFKSWTPNSSRCRQQGWEMKTFQMGFNAKGENMWFSEDVVWPRDDAFSNFKESRQPKARQDIWDNK